MQVAVVGFMDQVSPRLGQSQYVVMASIKDGHVQNATASDVHHLKGWDLPGFFQQHHVDVVVCGGILPSGKQRLMDLGIEVISGVTGPVSGALLALADGALTSGQMVPARSDKPLFAGEGSNPGRRRVHKSGRS